MSISDNLLLPIEGNLIDKIWSDQPAQTNNAILLLSSAVTGQKISDKINSIRGEMAEKKAHILVVTALDEVACKKKLSLCGG